MPSRVAFWGSQVYALHVVVRCGGRATPDDGHCIVCRRGTPKMDQNSPGQDPKASDGVLQFHCTKSHCFRIVAGSWLAEAQQRASGSKMGRGYYPTDCKTCRLRGNTRGVHWFWKGAMEESGYLQKNVTGRGPGYSKGLFCQHSWFWLLKMITINELNYDFCLF